MVLPMIIDANEANVQTAKKIINHPDTPNQLRQVATKRLLAQFAQDPEVLDFVQSRLESLYPEVLAVEPADPLLMTRTIQQAIAKAVLKNVTIASLANHQVREEVTEYLAEMYPTLSFEKKPSRVFLEGPNSEKLQMAIEKAIKRTIDEEEKERL